MVVVKTILLVLISHFCNGEFIIPEITLEAYTPKGFRATIIGPPMTELFGFHGKRNSPILTLEPGEFGEDILKSTNNNVWSYFNRDLELKVGDTIYFWMFIQNNKLGYRKDSQKWIVTELLEMKDTVGCEFSATMVSGQPVCKNTLILEDSYPNQYPTFDDTKWLKEQFYPSASPDFEFVSYQSKNYEVLFFGDHTLNIQPIHATDKNQLKGELDLGVGCTRSGKAECKVQGGTVFLINPVTSGRIVSKKTFRYGNVEIKAKLPAGDWIYPQIYLEQLSNPQKKIIIAYARGNEFLIGANNDDIGSRLLFAGPVLGPTEELHNKSQYLRSKKEQEPFSKNFHIYGLTWTEDLMTFSVDGVKFGEIDKATMQKINFAENDMVRLVLGVGVGGINDFPDGYRSGRGGTIEKPWRNKDRSQVKKFFEAASEWAPTWGEPRGARALKIEYIKIWSL